MGYSGFYAMMHGMVAVRPNLNKPGFITMHNVGRRGGVKYGNAEVHTDRAVLLCDAYVNVNKTGERKIRSGENKHPMASIVGNVVTELDFDEYEKELGSKEWVRVWYNPRDASPAFRTSSGKTLTKMNHALLFGKSLYAIP